MWIRMESWHIVKTWTRVPGRAITLCGKTAEGNGDDTYPPDQKTCETCLRINAKRAPVG